MAQPPATTRIIVKRIPITVVPDAGPRVPVLRLAGRAATLSPRSAR